MDLNSFADSFADSAHLQMQSERGTEDVNAGRILLLRHSGLPDDFDIRV